MIGRRVYFRWVVRVLTVVAGCGVFSFAGQQVPMVTSAVAAATTAGAAAPVSPPEQARSSWSAETHSFAQPERLPASDVAPVAETPTLPDMALVDTRPLASSAVETAAPAIGARTEDATLVPAVPESTRPFSDPQPLPRTLHAGLRSEQVRALQIRLRHAKVLATYNADGIFGPVTAAAVRKFQRRNDLPATGVVDGPTWDLLLTQSHDPTPAEMSNTDIGPWFVNPRQRVWMMELQDRLRQVGVYAGPMHGEFDDATQQAIERYRQRLGLPAGEVMDERTWTRLLHATHNPSYASLFDAPPASTMTQELDPRCLAGKVVCISKQQKRMSYVIDGQIQFTRPARFSLPQYDSPEGEFQVWYKNRDTVSRKFGERFPMPYAIFYDGNVAVHFSDDFAENGYDGGSHGCSQLDDYQAAKWLYEQVAVGDRVVVY